MSIRREFVACVLEQMHCWYLWGGKDPAHGLDCSGLVTYCLWKAGGPDWRQTHNTDRLWDELQAPGMLRPGDICLYGKRATEDKPADPNHVTVYLFDPGGSMGGVVIGASGGDSTTIDQPAAIKANARVKIHRAHLYRSDFLGFRSLPLGDNNNA